MTKEQFKVLVKAMKAVYTNPGFIPDQDAFDVWYSMLKDLDYATASRAVQMHMQTEETPPTVAGIRKQAVKLRSDELDGINEAVAWQLVWKAICNSGYHAEEEFKKLPETVKRAVGTASQLRQWALAEVDDKTITVWQSNFQRIYRLERQKELERIKLSPDVLKLIQGQNAALEQQNKAQIEQKRDEECIPMPDNVKNKLKKIFQEG